MVNKCCRSRKDVVSRSIEKGARGWHDGCGWRSGRGILVLPFFLSTFIFEGNRHAIRCHSNMYCRNRRRAEKLSNSRIIAIRIVWLKWHYVLDTPIIHKCQPIDNSSWSKFSVVWEKERTLGGWLGRSLQQAFSAITANT